MTLAEALDLEAQAVVRRISRLMSVYLYGSPRVIVMAWRCPLDTLRRRASYGGRKGRSAARRLLERGVYA